MNKANTDTTQIIADTPKSVKAFSERYWEEKQKGFMRKLKLIMGNERN